MRLRCAPLTVALLLALPSPAVSRTLFSPAIEGGGPTEGLVCFVLNTGRKALRPATAEVREDGGAVLSGTVLLEGLAPGSVARVPTLATVTPRTVTCAVDGKVSPRSVRITLCISGVPPYGCVTGP